MVTMVRHRGLDLSFSGRTEDATFIPCDSHGILSVNLYVSTQIPSKLAMLKHLFLDFLKGNLRILNLG